MLDLHLVSDTPNKAAALRRVLDGPVDLRVLDFAGVSTTKPPRHLVFDVDFSDARRAVEVKAWLERKPEGGKVIFAVDKASHFQVIQAQALGATDIVHRPIERRALMTALFGELASVSQDNPYDPLRSSPGVAEAFEALRSIFEAACVGAPLDMPAIDAAGEAVMRRMEADGLGSWLDTVRRHHNQTYQHCLIVTGVTVAFAQHIGLARRDQLRLSRGAILHDIGKARIPIAILEKPSSLSVDEMALLNKHPEYGVEALKPSPALDREMLDIVMHHHEYLDGSGYPHGLRGSEISDLVRIVTICDVFGALVEQRAYKPSLPADVAYQMLLDMGGKLDKDLVREFGFTKTLRFDHAA